MDIAGCFVAVEKIFLIMDSGIFDVFKLVFFGEKTVV